MKTKSLYLTVVMAFLFAVGCGSNNNVSCPAGEVNMNGSCQMSNMYGYSGLSNTSCQGSCPGGLVQTAYGCLSQANCSPCMGSYNGQCVQASAVGSVAGSYPYGTTSAYPYGTTGTAGYPYGYTGTAGYPYGYTSGYPYGYIP